MNMPVVDDHRHDSRYKNLPLKQTHLDFGMSFDPQKRPQLSILKLYWSLFGFFVTGVRASIFKKCSHVFRQMNKEKTL